MVMTIGGANAVKVIQDGLSAPELAVEELVPVRYRQDFPLSSDRRTIALIAKPLKDGRPG
jgi:hypothetical protein